MLNQLNRPVPVSFPFLSIGLDSQASQRLLRKFPERMVTEWVDITLAAKERFDSSFFLKSPADYLADNLNHAVTGTRTAPDWWYDIRKAEERKHASMEQRKNANRSSLPQRALNSVDDITQTIFQQFIASGQSESVAKENSKKLLAALQNRRKKSQ